MAFFLLRNRSEMALVLALLAVSFLVAVTVRLSTSVNGQIQAAVYASGSDPGFPLGVSQIAEFSHMSFFVNGISPDIWRGYQQSHPEKHFILKMIGRSHNNDTRLNSAVLRRI